MGVTGPATTLVTAPARATSADVPHVPMPTWENGLYGPVGHELCHPGVLGAGKGFGTRQFAPGHNRAVLHVFSQVIVTATAQPIAVL